jgi:hypothetical protein
MSSNVKTVADWFTSFKCRVYKDYILDTSIERKGWIDFSLLTSRELFDDLIIDIQSSTGNRVKKLDRCFLYNLPNIYFDLIPYELPSLNLLSAKVIINNQTMISEFSSLFFLFFAFNNLETCI